MLLSLQLAHSFRVVKVRIGKRYGYVQASCAQTDDRCFEEDDVKNGSFSAGIGMSLKTSLDSVGPRNHLRLPKLSVSNVSPVSCEYRSVVVSCRAAIISER